MTYEQKVLAAFRKVSAQNNEEGASATEVYEQMAKDKTISPMDTVIDIADIMDTLADKGFIGSRPK